MEEEKPNQFENIKKLLSETNSLLHKDEVIWPYQKLDIKDFTKRFFPHLSEKEAQKYFRLKPDKFMIAIENQLKAIDTYLRPLESRLNALDFQLKLFDFFSIYSPKKLKECQKILEKTPRAIREDFFSDKTLKLASKHGFNQKQVSELMTLWLNMRYYGAMSMGMSPKFLIPFLNTSDGLEEKKVSLRKAIEKVKPEIDQKWSEYDKAVFVKERLDEERKMMTFGPESVKNILSCLDDTYFYSVTGEISKEESLEFTSSVNQILNESTIIGKKENKTFISEEKRKEIIDKINKINEKPKLFFTIAQTTNSIRKNKDLNQEQEKTLQKIIKLGNLLPNNTQEALKHEQIKTSFGIIFEPLENLLHVEDLEELVNKKLDKKNKKKKGKKEEGSSGLKLLKDAIEGIAIWILERIKIEKKAGLENILELFNGIPPILGSDIVKLILKKKVKIDKEEFKGYLIEYLSKNGIYEVYSELSAGEAEKDKEIEVASEIIIPPQPDQRLAPILKQIKFEFMKFLETSTIKNQPLFDKLETHKVIPNNVVDILLENTQDMLINIINKNAENKLHEIIKADKKEYDVKLKTISLKLKPLMKNFDDGLINIIEKLDVYKLNENTLLSEFKEKVKDIWVNSLILKKKIEQQEISTSSVSSIAAKLMGNKPIAMKGPPKGPPTGPPKGPPTGPPKGPPTGPPKGPPTGPPKGPPTGPPKGPPTGPPKGPPTGPPKGPPTGPPKGPPTGPPKGPPTGPPKDLPEKIPPKLPPKGPAVIKPLGLQNNLQQGPPSKLLSESSPKIIPEIPQEEPLINASMKLSPGTVPKTPSVDISSELMPKEKIIGNSGEIPPKTKIMSTPSGSVTTPIPNDLMNRIEEFRAELPEDLPDVMLDSLKTFPSILKDSTKPERQLGVIDEKDQQKLAMIRKTIGEVENLLESYTDEPDKFSPEELKSALKLLSKVHKLNLEEVNPKEIREVITLAEELKMKRDIIAAQMDHLKSLDIEKKLSEASLKVLESNLELIVRYFDEYIEEIYKFLDYLGKKTSSYLEEYQKRAGEVYWKRARIQKAGIMLKENIQLLVKVSMLPDQYLKKAYKYYENLQDNRRNKKSNKQIGQAAKKFADIVEMKKSDILRLTRESEELILALEEIFKVRIKN